MKTTLTIIALSLMSAGAFAGGMAPGTAAEQQRFVFQGDGLVPNYALDISMKTRAEVQREAIAALHGNAAPSRLVFRGDGRVPRVLADTQRSRDAVEAEAERAAMARAASLRRPVGTR